MRLLQLRDQLLARDYPQGPSGGGPEEGHVFTKAEGSKKGYQQEIKPAPLCVPYDPKLPSLGSIMAKHYRAITHSHLATDGIQKKTTVAI